MLRRIPSRCANWLMAKLSGVDIHDFGTTFKAYRREVIHNIPLYGEMHRFIPALASWYGASICEIPIRNVNRERGKSHYGIGRTFRVFFDLLTIRFLLKYMGRPMHFFGGFGALGILGGTLMAMILLGMKIVHPSMSVMGKHEPMFGADRLRHPAAGHRPAWRAFGAPLLHRPASRLLHCRPARAFGLIRRAEHDVGTAGRELLRAGTKGRREQGLSNDSAALRRLAVP
jgi:hypothetical protein